MKTTQHEVAKWAGISNALLSMIRSPKGERYLTIRTAKVIELHTDIPVKQLILISGEKLWLKLSVAYRKAHK